MATDKTTPPNPRSFFGLEAYVGAHGDVILKNTGMGDDGHVSIHPDHVDQVVQWLKELKADAMESKKQLAEEYNGH